MAVLTTMVLQLLKILFFYYKPDHELTFFLNCCECVCVFVAVFGIISIGIMVLLCLWSPSVLWFLLSVFSAVWYAWADRDSIQDKKAHLCWLHLAMEVWWCPFSIPVCCVCVFSCVRWSSRQTVYRTRKLTCADYTWLWRCDDVLSVLQFVVFVSLPVRWSRRLAQCTGPESSPVPTAPGCGGVMVSFQYSSLLHLSSAVWDDRGDWHSVQDQNTWLWRCDGVLSVVQFVAFVLSCVRWSSRPARFTGPKSCPVLTTPGCGGVMVSFQLSSLLHLSSAVWDDRADRHGVQDQKAALCWLHLAVEVWRSRETTPLLAGEKESWYACLCSCWPDCLLQSRESGNWIWDCQREVWGGDDWYTTEVGGPIPAL